MQQTNRICIYMKRETRRYIKDLAYYSSLGLSVALSIFIGLGIGVYLDKVFDTGPVLTLIFLVLGIAAGYRNIALAIKKSRNF
jgi:ATP synthase protein I